MNRRFTISAVIPGLLVVALAGAPTNLESQEAPAALTPEEEKAADMRMPELDRSGLLPELRQPIEVSAEERNPFALATKTLERIAGIVTDTERDRIERLLRAMRISGTSDSPYGRRVLLGSLSLTPGQELPPLFADQVDRVVVKAITDREVLLEFVEGEASKPGGSMSLPINMPTGKPSVRSLLIGEAFRSVVPDGDGSSSLPALRAPAAQAVMDGSEEQQLQSLVDRRTELLDAPASTSTDETSEP